MKIRIDEITLADDINIRQELRQDVVDRYAEILDDLPPIQLWRPNGKLLLADGWHRIAAATQIGRIEIEAEIHEGDRTEAIVAAIVANTRHGIPLSMAERNRAIGRLVEAGWSQRRIGRELGLHESRVRQIIEAAYLGTHVPAPIADSAIRAPREYRLPVAETALASGWSQQETRQVATALADPLIPDDQKREILAKRTTEIDGRQAIPADLVVEYLRQAKERRAGAALLKFISVADEVIEKLKRDKQPLEGMNARDKQDLAEGLDTAELVIQKVRAML